LKFLKNVIKTMKDTTWLNAKETRRDTTTVIISSLLFIGFFAVVDWVIQSALSLLV
jgi:preprotein translocase subunit SecE